MRKAFPGYYVERDDAFFQKLWAEGRFVFDANMLLNFFRYSPSTRESLYGFLSLRSVKDRLWIPHQVALEYHRNLHDVRYEPVSACVDLADQLKKAHSKLRADEHRERVEKLLADVEQFTKDARDRFESSTEAAWVRKIGELYDGKVGPEWSDSSLGAAYKEGEQRYKRKVPPGFADASSKSGDERFGDLIVWKQVIEFAKTGQAGVVLVTDDAKDDWWLRVDGKTAGPHPGLLNEMAREAPGVLFHLYSGKQFLKHAKKHLSADLSEKSIEEVRRVEEEQREAFMIDAAMANAGSSSYSTTIPEDLAFTTSGSTFIPAGITFKSVPARYVPAGATFVPAGATTSFRASAFRPAGSVFASRFIRVGAPHLRCEQCGKGGSGPSQAWHECPKCQSVTCDACWVTPRKDDAICAKCQDG